MVLAGLAHVFVANWWSARGWLVLDGLTHVLVAGDWCWLVVGSFPPVSFFTFRGALSLQWFLGGPLIGASESGSLLFGPSYFSNSQDIAALLQGKVVLNAHFEC